MKDYNLSYKMIKKEDRRKRLSDKLFLGMLAMLLIAIIGMAFYVGLTIGK